MMRDSAGRETVRAVRVQKPPTVDGSLDEQLYALIPKIDGFLQQEPQEGQAATQRTYVWVLYDDIAVYVFARCRSTDPARIVANARFRWEFDPGSDLFVVYSEGRDTAHGQRPSPAPIPLARRTAAH
jgi:hypothetical protein